MKKSLKMVIVTHNGFTVTATDIQRYDWQSRLSAVEWKECRHYSGALGVAAEECKVADDDVGQRVFSFLSAVASFRANYDVTGNPYVSMIVWANGDHSLCAEELTEENLLALKGIVENITDPEFQARVADLLWVMKKDFKAAIIAVRAFLASAQRLKENNLVIPHNERLQRAAQICANSGFEKERAAVLSVIDSAIDEFKNQKKPDHICHNLMSILLMVKQGDPIKYSELSEKLATDCATIGDWHISEMYWQFAEQWYRRAKKNADLQRCQLAAAECNISRGEAELKKQGSMSAAHWYGRGVEALRRAKAEPERVKAVHLRFLELEKLGLKDMKTLDSGLDKQPEFRERERQAQARAADFVRGLDFPKAIKRFAYVTQPLEYNALKNAYLEASKGMIANKLFGSSVVDHTGKVADWIPPQSLTSDTIDPESLRKLLCQQASRVDWPIRVIWMIEPARMTILEEHPVRLQDLFYLVFNNPFIPQGHEGIYLRGLHAGFLGDWLVAMHLLVPQIEASFRYVLQQHNVITSTLDSDGLQPEREINQLLWLPETEKIFGIDLMFDLRGILIEKFGHNLRNQLAHGLLPEGGFYREASVYLWWLMLRICWIGFRLVQPPDTELELSVEHKKGARHESVKPVTGKAKTARVAARVTTEKKGKKVAVTGKKGIDRIKVAPPVEAQVGAQVEAQVGVDMKASVKARIQEFGNEE